MVDKSSVYTKDFKTRFTLLADNFEITENCFNYIENVYNLTHI